MDYLPARYVDDLRRQLPNARFGACEPVFDQTRMYKTPAERDVMEMAFRGTEVALKETFLATRPGVVTVLLRQS